MIPAMHFSMWHRCIQKIGDEVRFEYCIYYVLAQDKMWFSNSV